jgi:hypothetical protein
MGAGGWGVNNLRPLFNIIHPLFTLEMRRGGFKPPGNGESPSLFIIHLLKFLYSDEIIFRKTTIPIGL